MAEPPRAAAPAAEAAAAAALSVLSAPMVLRLLDREDRLCLSLTCRALYKDRPRGSAKLRRAAFVGSLSRCRLAVGVPSQDVKGLGMPLDGKTCTAAAHRNEAETLRWLLAELDWQCNWPFDVPRGGAKPYATPQPPGVHPVADAVEASTVAACVGASVDALRVLVDEFKVVPDVRFVELAAGGEHMRRAAKALARGYALSTPPEAEGADVTTEAVGRDFDFSLDYTAILNFAWSENDTRKEPGTCNEVGYGMMASPHDAPRHCPRVLRTLQFLKSRNWPLSAKVAAWLCSAGDLPALRWAVEHGCPLDELAAAWSAMRGRMDCLRFIVESGAPVDPAACAWAARRGDLTMLDYLKSCGAPIDSDALSWAAAGGELAAAQWCYMNGSPLSERASQWASYFGHDAVVRWLHSVACPMTTTSCSWASLGGRQHTLALLRDLGCQWNEQVALYAADSGHWALVQWLHAQGCPLSRDVAHRLYLETEELAFLANVA